MENERQPGYSAQQILGLLDGTIWDENGQPEQRATWAELRSSIERRGDVESEAMAAVIDLERALTAMVSPSLRHRRDHRTHKDAKAAALIISGRLLLDYDVSDFRAAFGKGNGFDPEKLMRKGAAWVSCYLSGKSVEEAERAFRRAK